MAVDVGRRGRGAPSAYRAKLSTDAELSRHGLVSSNGQARLVVEDPLSAQKGCRSHAVHTNSAPAKNKHVQI